MLADYLNKSALIDKYFAFMINTVAKLCNIIAKNYISKIKFYSRGNV